MTTRLLLGIFVFILAASNLPAQVHPAKFQWFEYANIGSAPDSSIGADEYRNPIVSGFYPDPSVCRAGDDFYLINSTFSYFPGIPVFHSVDLVHWQQIGNVIDRPEQLRYAGLPVSSGIFAPAITAHDGTFYVICTMVGSNGNFVVTATNPAGPWSNPTILPFEGIDPSLFFDDDGKAWVVNNGGPEGKPLYDGHRAIWIQEFDPAAKRMVGPRKVIVNGGVNLAEKPIWIEGPHLLKKDSWYYLTCAEGGTGPAHSQVVFRSQQVEGPYQPWDRNPILTQRNLDPNVPDAVTCTGHASLVVGPDKNWWAVFLGVRPYQGRFSPMGRETFLLPVQWTDDGWPTILAPGKRVPLTSKAPSTASRPPTGNVPLTGNFTWRDDFKDTTLSPLWLTLRTSGDTWWKVGSGQLSLTPRPDSLSGTGNPSFLGHRVQNASFSATTAVEIPTDQGVSVGLAAFQNETHNYFFAVRCNSDGATVYLEQAKGGPPVTIGSSVLPKADNIQLRIEGHDATCSFEYSSGDGSWKTLVADADATLLTTDVAGGFVGATVGPHARIDSTPQPNQPASK